MVHSRFFVLLKQSFSLNQEDEAKLYVTKAKEFLGRLPTKEVKVQV